ncbi:hypothetical protein QF045_002950 [Pseudomonas sp. W4I3]|nr:hypothetical protein [Pseudomonas sp. W4I3]
MQRSYSRGREEAQECKAAWQALLRLEQSDSLH